MGNNEDINVERIKKSRFYVLEILVINRESWIERQCTNTRCTKKIVMEGKEKDKYYDEC